MSNQRIGEYATLHSPTVKQTKPGVCEYGVQISNVLITGYDVVMEQPYRVKHEDGREEWTYPWRLSPPRGSHVTSTW